MRVDDRVVQPLQEDEGPGHRGNAEGSRDDHRSTQVSTFATLRESSPGAAPDDEVVDRHDAKSPKGFMTACGVREILLGRRTAIRGAPPLREDVVRPQGTRKGEERTHSSPL